MTRLETPRLQLRLPNSEDASFVLELYNDPDCLRFIGDKQIHSLEDAQRYIEDGPLASFNRHGHGLLCCVEKRSGQVIGVCGLLQREALHFPDLGFAFLPRARRQGFAREACAAVIEALKAGHPLQASKLLALTAVDNSASMALLGQLGFAQLGCVTLRGESRLSQLFCAKVTDLVGRQVAKP